MSMDAAEALTVLASTVPLPMDGTDHGRIGWLNHCVSRVKEGLDRKDAEIARLRETLEAEHQDFLHAEDRADQNAADALELAGERNTLEAAAKRVVACFEHLGRCEDEFLPEYPTACSEHQEALDTAILDLRRTLGTEPAPAAPSEQWTALELPAEAIAALDRAREWLGYPADAPGKSEGPT